MLSAYDDDRPERAMQRAADVTTAVDSLYESVKLNSEKLDLLEQRLGYVLNPVLLEKPLEDVSAINSNGDVSNLHNRLNQILDLVVLQKKQIDLITTRLDF